MDDLARASEERGVAALDVTAALAAAEPGAFLDRDIHMTPKGHDAVARVLAAKLAEPPPAFPTGELPEGRSKLPVANRWYGEQSVPGARKAGCRVAQVEEWLRIYCYGSRKSEVKPRGVRLLEGGRGDAMTFTTTRAMLLLAPLGDPLVAEFAWSDRVERFEAGKGKYGFAPPRPLGPDDRTGPTALETKLMTCLKGSGQMQEQGWQLQLGADDDCARTYGDDCERLLECAQANPASPPDCARGAVNAGVMGRCHALCGAGQPCAQGRCNAWPGTHVCE